MGHVDRPCVDVCIILQVFAAAGFLNILNWIEASPFFGGLAPTVRYSLQCCPF